LREGRITRVDHAAICISEQVLLFGSEWIGAGNNRRISDFATADGFISPAEMWEWFMREYGAVTKRMIVIQWHPL